MTELMIDPDEVLLAGHYPGFPILPGVCVVDCAHRSVLAVVSSVAELREVESARFAGPVLPGDHLTCELRWSRAHETLRCHATLRTARGKAATVRLRYVEAGA